tara:strand:- start:544 stop:2010 length:1467 start_codon:yes stop_codon:yes gene_type:complete
MLFNSIDFAIFLPLAFLIYWALNKSLKLQNIFLLIVSYIFYGWWDWRFLSLIIFSTLIDYSIGVALSTEKKMQKRKFFLWISIFVNIGFLGFFKYYNFFLDNFITAFSFFGSQLNTGTLNIILPVGISFYTFQTLSYTIDVYYEKLKPTKDIIAFSAFVSFFPQLVAGPIERASNLLPQFKVRKRFDYSKAVEGMRQILWGFFKKIVIADTCAIYSNMIFNDYTSFSGVALFFGAILFAFQIYGDFSGYSDIAIGSSRLFGFNLMQNFNFPYFSRDIAEFWRRWHISLSTWFRDYLYIPIGGSRGSNFNKIRNVFIIFIVSGFWHGANWTFVAWGALNAIYFLPLLILNKNRKHKYLLFSNNKFPNFKEFFQISSTFILISISWIFFRSDDIYSAFEYIYLMISGLFYKAGLIQILDLFYYKIGWEFTLIFLFFIVFEWMGKETQYGIEKLFINKRRKIRFLIYYLILIIVMWYSINGTEQDFIYFQF